MTNMIPNKSLKKCTVDFVLWAASPLLSKARALSIALWDFNNRRRDRSKIDHFNHGKKIIIPKRRKPPKLMLKNISRETALKVQKDSALLQKLPPEIRNMIWKKAIGGRTIHLWYKEKKFGHLICVCPSEDPKEWNYQYGCRLKCWKVGQSYEKEILGLVLSCRLM